MLLSEEKLAKKLGVSRITLQSELRILFGESRMRYTKWRVYIRRKVKRAAHMLLFD
jgi:AraC-like DNA-binding protein